jgi:hypothetical protein
LLPKKRFAPLLCNKVTLPFGRKLRPLRVTLLPKGRVALPRCFAPLLCLSTKLIDKGSTKLIDKKPTKLVDKGSTKLIDKRPEKLVDPLARGAFPCKKPTYQQTELVGWQKAKG